jgi:hypothetical protein
MTTNYDKIQGNGFIPNKDTDVSQFSSIPRSSTPRFDPRQPEAVLSKTAMLRQAVLTEGSILQDVRDLDALIGAECEHQAARAIDAADQANELAQHEYEDFVILEKAHQNQQQRDEAKLGALQREFDLIPERLERAKLEAKTEFSERHNSELENHAEQLGAFQESVEAFEQGREATFHPYLEKITAAEDAELVARGAANAILEVGADPTPVTARESTLKNGDAGALGLETPPVKTMFAQVSRLAKDTLIVGAYGLLFGLNIATLFFKIPANQIGLRFELQPLEIMAAATIGLALAFILGVPTHGFARRTAFNRQMDDGILPSDIQTISRQRWFRLTASICLSLAVIAVLLEAAVNYGGLAGDRLAALAQLEAQNKGRISSGNDAGLHVSLLALCFLSGFSLIAYKAAIGFAEGELAANSELIAHRRAEIVQAALDREEAKLARELTGRTIATKRELERVEQPLLEMRARIDGSRPVDLNTLGTRQALEVEVETKLRCERIETEASNLSERLSETKRNISANQSRLNAILAESSQRIEDAYARAEWATERFDRIRAAAIAGCDRQYLAGLIANFEQTVIVPGTTRHKPTWLRILERLLQRSTPKPRSSSSSKDLN